MLNNHAAAWRVAGLATLLLVFISVAGWYSMTIPLGEGPDEPGHVEYVFFMARTGRLPDQRRNEVPGEGHQPPLAYWLMRPLVAPEPARQVHLAANPRWLWAGGDQIPAFNRRSVDIFPYRNEALAWHLMRGISVLCGATTVLLTWAIGRRMGLSSALAGAGAALLACWPQFIFHSALVSNDPLLWTLAAGLVWLVLGRQSSSASIYRPLSLGLVLGAALLTKQSALALVPVAVLGVWWGSLPAQRWRGLISLLVTTVGVVGWWYWRNLALYGDLFGLQAYQQAFTSPLFDPTLAAHWRAAGRALGASLIARFGWMNLSPPGWVFGTACAIIGSALAGWLLRRHPLKLKPAQANQRLRYLVAGLPLLALGWTLLFALISGQVAWQGRFVLLAGPVLALGLATGLVQLAGRTGLALAIGALFLIDCWLPAGLIAPAYPAQIVAAQDQAPSVGRWVPDSGAPFELREIIIAAPARPGTPLKLATLWHTSGPQDRDWMIFVHLAVPGSDELIFDYDVPPQQGAFPASRWTVDDWWRDVITLPLPPTLPAGEYELRLGWFDPATDQRIGLRSTTGTLLGDYLVAERLRVGP